MNQPSNTPLPPVTQALSFLARQTGQDEAQLLSRALRLGLDLLYRQAVEQAFIEGELSRAEALLILGAARVQEIEYAQQALAQDVARGLEL